ncbi:MAG: (2Fe-2S)-binding protein [Gemmataceae bacterium]|nr:(2Fe-2S)-binding protein [Gemmataceae bacterium]
MSTTCTAQRCDTCPAKVVCRCLNVTEEQVVNLITGFGLRTIREIRHHTGAGDGCTCCHAELAQYLDRYALAVVD